MIHRAPQSDGTYVYFQIQQYYDPVTHQHLYDIYDCGTGGGYGSCTSLNASQMAYSNPEGVVAAETNYGCTVRIMGSASAPQHYGSNANPVEGFVTVWATRSPWSYVSSANVCPTDYHGALVTGGMVTWDSRN
ncbi:MAG TPA: hypothetical protein VGS62_10840 [Streptosporangiaceae bacterium]|nr:hypothetical protein [Streptosporangiaceae bacterium]